METVGKLNTATFPDLICKDQVICEVNSFKYLGVMVDSTLKFNDHTNYIKGKVFFKMKPLRCIRTFNNDKLALQLSKSLILPHIDYVDIVFGKL